MASAGLPLARGSNGDRRGAGGLRVGAGLAAILIGILALFALTFAFPQPLREPEVAPTLWPRMLLLLLLATAIADRVGAGWAGSDAAVQEPGRKLVGARPACAAAALFAYGAGLHFLGFHVATPLFVAAAAPVFGLKRPVPIAATALAATLAIGVGFVGLLYLPLPRGELALFHELNARADAFLISLRP